MHDCNYYSTTNSANTPNCNDCDVYEMVVKIINHGIVIKITSSSWKCVNGDKNIDWE